YTAGETSSVRPTKVGVFPNDVPITVTRQGGVAGTLSVQVNATGGTATAGADYAFAPLTLTLADGETSKTFDIPVRNDAFVEGDETVALALANPTGGATLGNPSTAVLTIHDNGGTGYALAADVSALVSVTPGRAHRQADGRSRQKVVLRNTGSQALYGPLSLVLDRLPRTVTLANKAGLTRFQAPLGSPYVEVGTGADHVFSPGEEVTVTLVFRNPQGRHVTHGQRVLAGQGLR